MSEAVAARAPYAAVPASPMPTIVRSLVWRFVRHGWQTLLLPLVVLCGVPTLCYVSIRIIEPVVLLNLVEGTTDLKRAYFMLTIGSLPTMVLIAMFRVRPLYTLPVSTRLFINTHLMLGIAAVSVLHLFTVAYYHTVLGAAIPIFGPLLFLIPAVVIFGGVAALLVDARWWKPIVAVVTLIWLIWRLISRFDHSRALEGAEWFTPTRAELLILLPLAMAGYWIAMTTATRDRRGATESLEEYFRRAMVWLDGWWPSSIREGLLMSPLTAQRDYEWQKSGLAMPLVVLVFGGLSLVGAYDDPLEWFHGLIQSFPFLLILGTAINGYLVGVMDGANLCGEMDRYRATRPLTDRQLASAAMRNGLSSSAWSLAVLAVLAIIVYVYALMCGHSHRELWTVPLSGGLWGPFGYLGTLLIGAMLGWAGMGFNLSCIATGRTWVVPTLWMSGMGLLIVGMLLQHLLSEEQMLTLIRSAGIIVGVLAAAGTVYSLWRATSRQLIPGSAWLACGVAWMVALGMLLAGFPQLLESDVAARVVFFAGVAALVPLPLASVPLAISWNRHR